MIYGAFVQDGSPRKLRRPSLRECACFRGAKGDFVRKLFLADDAKGSGVFFGERTNDMERPWPKKTPDPVWLRRHGFAEGIPHPKSRRFEERNMPIYEYSCRQCTSDFELLIRGSESPQCPQCGSHELEKQFSVPAAHSASRSRLPICEPPSDAGCGLPQCGAGRCMRE
jgi:putative FmdB family regulatory protein